MTRNHRANALKEIANAMSDASNEYNNVYYIGGTCYLRQRLDNGRKVYCGS